jgi:uncharacterized protein (DUF305 family)
MSNRHWGGLAAILTATMVAACNSATGPAGNPLIDRVYLDSLAAHHAAVVVAARQAMTSATHPELQAWAKTLVDEEEGELEQLNGWRLSWFRDSKVTPPGPVPIPVAGKAFDEGWLRAMVPEFQQAGVLARNARAAHVRSELYSLAHLILDEHQSHQDKATLWLQQWYGVTPP